MMKILLLVYLLSFQCFGMNSRIAMLPKTKSVMRQLLSRTKQYLILLKEASVLIPLGNGCLRLQKYDMNERRDLSYFLCADSKTESNQLTDTITLSNENGVVQKVILTQLGKNLKPSSLDDLFNLHFHFQSHKGQFTLSGLTDLVINFSGEDSFNLFYPPIKFNIQLMIDKNSARNIAKYKRTCIYCDFNSAKVVEILNSNNEISSIQYFTHDYPVAVTPRHFDEVLASILYGPLARLGSSVQQSLVYEANFPEIQF